jgi:tRNA A-37 threonylcarbamoyl transferase component Bud32
VIQDRERNYIKFVGNLVVHEKCAKMDIAPKLRGLEDIGAGWKMVIMDTRHGEYGPFDKDTLRAGTCGQRGESLAELHQANFVHGDVKGVNMVARKHDKLGFMLVDFDYLVMDHW